MSESSLCDANRMTAARCGYNVRVALGIIPANPGREVTGRLQKKC
jgi:hypothetical protein